ncbi:receptor-type tyrosine-protein phosphatase C-like [Toxotes jaculatrix]|uniref:receptor-type tyrosine-protein phosphatase C-like n=1 Tax=Toxotes jaculatrix TaxID=941984 RepID=UPI001B3B06ED|nr:receptor-type tyrosine-protein phosphatase C-like [Toxotes jaculatrix]XP_040895648.1 receptor-type tyrosine-protein phosphatase C-like [Toxotes jaculatrix]
MAGLCVLKILLLWAGVIGWTKSPPPPQSPPQCKNDIEDEANCISGHVCYRSNWDISSLQSTPAPAEQCGSKVFCFKPGITDICSDFTTTLTSENCGNSSFSLTKHIPVGFLNTTEISQNVSKQFPVKIEATLPPNCKNLAIDYTCWEHDGVNEPKNLSELEPFTNYSCTGQIKDNNVPIGNTAAVDFRIDCDFTIKITTERVTDTSTGLRWNTTSRNCQQVLHDLQKFSYDCSCGPSPSDQKHRVTANKQPSGGTCHITGLQPYTSYTCEVQPSYDNNRVAQPTRVKQTTEIGTPEDIMKLTMQGPVNNVISVQCVHSKRFNGPEETYIARLHYGSDTLQESNTKCEFEFRDLRYATSYTVQVTAFNG